MIKDENLFLADAQKIVVERRAGNDRLRRTRRTASIVNKYGWIAGAGADGALAGLHRRLHDHRSASDEQQAGVFVFADRIEGIERRLFDDAADVFNARLAVNRLVVGAHGGGGAMRCTRMRIENRSEE